jgi:hypothetical protein
MKMKNLIMASLCALAVTLSASAVLAQTNTTPNLLPTGSFMSSVASYFTSFNTNQPFAPEHAELWTGIDQSQNNLGAAFGVQVELPDSFVAEAVVRNADVLGTVTALQGGAGWSYTYVDTKLVGGIDGGYRLDTKVGFIEPYLDVRKMLTANTFAGLRLYYEQDFSSGSTAHAPGIEAITGFKF